MSIQKDGFLSYNEFQGIERRARQMRADALRSGVATLFGRNKNDRAASRAK